MCNLKKKTVNITKKKQAQKYRKQTRDEQRGEGWGMGKIREGD